MSSPVACSVNPVELVFGHSVNVRSEGDRMSVCRSKNPVATASTKVLSGTISEVVTDPDESVVYDVLPMVIVALPTG
jgi:hypothetical protein